MGAPVSETLVTVLFSTMQLACNTFTTFRRVQSVPPFIPARKTLNVPCCSLNDFISSLELFVKQILPHSQRRSNASHTLPILGDLTAIFEGSEGGEGQCGAQIAFSVPDRLVYFGTILLGRSLCSARLDLSATHAFVHLHCLKVYATHDLNSQTQLADRHPICSLTTTCRLCAAWAPTSSITVSSAMTDAL